MGGEPSGAMAWLGDLTHGLMRARTMLQKSKAKNCKERLERVTRLATGSWVGGRLAGVCNGLCVVFFSNLGFTIVRDFN